MGGIFLPLNLCTMKKLIITILMLSALIVLLASFSRDDQETFYQSHYKSRLLELSAELDKLQAEILNSELDQNGLEKIKTEIHACRRILKSDDFWLRYFDPTTYRKINGPLPVEWETEVFEKFEKPYRREGAGLTLAELYLDEGSISRDSLLHLVSSAHKAVQIFLSDSITGLLSMPDHFFLCNRLYLLNLAAIYTTGFECPDPASVIPETEDMLEQIRSIYHIYNRQFPNASLGEDYLKLYDDAFHFVRAQPKDFELFDHYKFIRDYVNPLFALNQKMLKQYNCVSQNNNDYTLNTQVNSIFSKELYRGQNIKGIFHRVKDQNTLAQIEALGKLLFYDPILSGNNKRSCASCHVQENGFADNSVNNSLQFDHQNRLSRNSVSLLNAPYNHLVMTDGKHLSLQEQVLAVISNPLEMGGNEEEALEKVLSCKTYKNGFRALLVNTPQEKEITTEHIASAITFYYGKFSKYTSAFDRGMNQQMIEHEDVKKGFNLFMSKAQCATCHFVPQFNGVKPPYLGSEFEVLGTPADTLYQMLSEDKGRYLVNPAFETMSAFRTGTLRNVEKTAPYMHNGVFKNLEQVLEFYKGGGGAGRGLKVDNQTLSADSLRLTKTESQQIIAFMKSLSEDIPVEAPPARLPVSKFKEINNRIVKGTY